MSATVVFKPQSDHWKAVAGLIQSIRIFSEDMLRPVPDCPFPDPGEGAESPTGPASTEMIKALLITTNKNENDE